MSSTRRRSRFTRSNTPLLEPVLALIAGILCRDFSTTLQIVLGAALLSFGITYGMIRRTPRPAGWIVLVACGYLLAGAQQTEIVIPKGERLEFIGRVETIPTVRGRWIRAESSVYSYRDSLGKWHPTEEHTQLYADTSQRLAVGDVIHYRARMYPVDSGSYGRYMARQGITGRSFSYRIRHLGRDTVFAHRVALFRDGLGERISQNPQSDPEGSIMQALSTGDQSGIDRSLRQSYARSGVAHLLSISGMHVGIIFLFLNLLLGWFRLVRGGRVVTGCLVILSLAGYALLTGLSPSVLRAVLMFSLLQIGLIFSRYTNPLNTLCAAALFLLLWNPYYLYNIGFQLSFAAMVGILTLYPPLSRLWRPTFAPIRWLWSLTLVTVTAQIGALPLAVFHFGQLPLFTVALNPVIWFTVPVIVIGSLLVLATGWVWIETLTRQITAWQNTVIERTAAIEWSAVEQIDLSIGGCCAIYTVILTGIWLMNRYDYRFEKWSESPHKP